MKCGFLMGLKVNPAAVPFSLVLGSSWGFSGGAT